VKGSFNYIKLHHRCEGQMKTVASKPKNSFWKKLAHRLTLIAIVTAALSAGGASSAHAAVRAHSAMRAQTRATPSTAQPSANEPKVIPVWPGVAPGSEGWTQQEHEVFAPQLQTKIVQNVTRPTLTAFFPEASARNGTAVIVCPGGAFHFLAIEHEGTQVATWLNSLGITAFVLKYRLIRTGDNPMQETTDDLRDPAKMAELMKMLRPLVLADSQQAMKVVREHAADWGIAPDRIGIMGFSAGGAVTASLALQHDSASRPDFAAPIYGLAPEQFTVPEDAAPMFILCADDDPLVPPSQSVRLYSAWHAAGHPTELHIYAKGGHGFGMRKQGLPADHWPDRLADWLRAQGFLKPAH
jgi:acetyl esterase/lipase